jgi:hypothetical protein
MCNRYPILKVAPQNSKNALGCTVRGKGKRGFGGARHVKKRHKAQRGILFAQPPMIFCLLFWQQKSKKRGKNGYSAYIKHHHIKNASRGLCRPNARNI